MIDFLKPPIKADLVVIDSTFPQKEPYAFRNSEINEYIRRIKNFKVFTMFPMMPDKSAWFTHGYGVTRGAYEENLAGYKKQYPGNTKRIHYLNDNRKYRIGLAYSFFLGETYVLLPFYEKHGIPFVFVLYPGGCFGLDFEGSNSALRRIFSSPYFKGVIVTQKITHDYLLKHNLCKAREIHYVYGGFVQFRRSDVMRKQYYQRDKATFDICFVAAKYTERGVDKGYDLFVETAKWLIKTCPDARFHVVGGFGPEDIDVKALDNKITFYGYKTPIFLKKFYSTMDIFLSPNRPHKIFPGNFDGFPLGIDASYCGVGLFVTDKLKMNQHYSPNREIVIIDTNAERIANEVKKYYNNPRSLYDLSMRGQRKTQKLFNIDYQIDQRLRVFRGYTTIEEIT